MNQQAKKNGPDEPIKFFLIVLVLAVVAWVLYWQVVEHFMPTDPKDPDKAFARRGQFGDMFGGINALFSALALAVLAYTMWLQRKELRLQREELESTRLELSRTAAAQERSEAALCKQVDAMESYAKAARFQVRAMIVLAKATKAQLEFERTFEEHRKAQTTAMVDQATAMKQLADAIADFNSRNSMNEMMRRTY